MSEDKVAAAKKCPFSGGLYLGSVMYCKLGWMTDKDIVDKRTPQWTLRQASRAKWAPKSNGALPFARGVPTLFKSSRKPHTHRSLVCCRGTLGMQRLPTEAKRKESEPESHVRAIPFCSKPSPFPLSPPRTFSVEQLEQVQYLLYVSR